MATRFPSFWFFEISVVLKTQFLSLAAKPPVVLLEVMRSLCSFLRKRLSKHPSSSQMAFREKKKKHTEILDFPGNHWLSTHVSKGRRGRSSILIRELRFHATVLAKRFKKRNKNRNAYKCFPSGTHRLLRDLYSRV